MTPLYDSRRPDPHARFVRGAHLTTQEAAQADLRARYPHAPLTITFGGVKGWPTERYLNKFVFVTGAPGVGKTTFLYLLLRDQAALFDVDGLRLRWLILDPTNTFTPYTHQVLPPHVPIWHLDPGDECGMAHDLARDIGTDELMAQAAVDVIFPAELSKHADPFWVTAARDVALALLRVFIDRGSQWTLADWVRPFTYKRWLSILLKQSARTRGMVRSDLAGKQGKGIRSVAAAEMNKLAYVAAASEHCGRSYSFTGQDGFLNRNVVAVLRFDPTSMHGTGLYANLLAELMSLHAFKRNDERNNTVLWADEGRYMNRLPIVKINARGRAGGLGCVLTSVGVPALCSTWGQEKTDELIDGVFSWAAFSCGRKTANAFSELVGDVAAVEGSHTDGRTQTTNWGRSWCTRMSPNPPQASLGYSEADSASTSYALQVRPAVLPSELTHLPGNPVGGRLEFYLFNRDLGCFRTATPFLDVYRDLPTAPPPSRRRPDNQFKLRPFTRDDCERLNLDMTTEVLQAVHDAKDFRA